MHSPDFAGATFSNRANEFIPIGMIRQSKAARTPSPGRLRRRSHPTRDKRGGVGGKFFLPMGGGHSGRSDEHGLGTAFAQGGGIAATKGWKRDASLGVNFGEAFDIGMDDDGADGRIQKGEESLRLAEGIGNEKAGVPGLLIDLPPLMNLLADLGNRWPTICGEAKGAFGHKDVAAERLEWLARRVWRALVVARDDPDFPLIFEPYLGGAEDMPCGMQGEANAVDGDGFAKREFLYFDAGTDAGTNQPGAGGGCKDGTASLVKMVGVGVGDDRSRNRARGINGKPSNGAMKAIRSVFKQAGHLAGPTEDAD